MAKTLDRGEMMLNSTKISILLATDFPILRESLGAIFKETEDLELKGISSSIEETIAQLEQIQPNVVLLDVSLAADRLLSLLETISGKDRRILLIGSGLNRSQTIEALRHGAGGVIGRKTTPELLCKSVRAVVSGDIWIDRQVTSELVQFLRNRAAQSNGQMGQVISEMIPPGTASNNTDRLNPKAGQPDGRFDLTKRELQIINALVEGQTNRDIAATFGISEYTVKHHLTNIFDKLGVYNRVELVLFALNHQLCPSAVDRPPVTAISSSTVRPINAPTK